MPEPGLIDTGAILALVDPDDEWHHACVEVKGNFELPLITSLAVLTETFYMTGKDRRGIAAVWRLTRSGALTVAEIDDRDLANVEALMARYRDRPMDFADATLVHLAERESLSAIFTVDHNDFETYRIKGRRPFRILPERGRFRR